MVTISHEIGEIDIQLNPYRLGELFAAMNSQEQMRFLNGFSTSVKNWPVQCRWIAEEFDLAELKLMKQKALNALEDLVEHLEVENLENE